MEFHHNGVGEPVPDGEKFKLMHHYHVEYRNADGELEWTEDFDNIIPDAWLNKSLNVLYGSVAKPSAFYIGLVNGASTPTFAAADTMGSHAGWTETVPYSDATRPAWTSSGDSTAKSISNGSGATFNINATATVAGCFVTSVNTKSGTTGDLCSEGAFGSGNKSVANGGTLTVTVTVTAS